MSEKIQQALEASIVCSMALVLIGACASEDSTPVDAGDTGLEDAGAACSSSAECGSAGSRPSSCPACAPYNSAICAAGQCLRPGPVPVPHSVRFRLQPSLISEVRSFAGAVVDQRTVEGVKLDCEQLLSADLSASRYNVVDSRRAPVALQEDTSAITFNGFPTGREVFFLIYGFPEMTPDGSPLGWSCTPHTVCTDCGTMSLTIAGTMMTRL